MSNPESRGDCPGRAPRFLRASLYAVMVAGLVAVAVLGRDLALLAFEPPPATTAQVARPVDPQPAAEPAASDADRRSNGTLLIVGGRTPEVAFQRFLELAGGRDARVVLIPSASTRFAEGERVKEELEEWRKRGPASVQMLHTRSREVANDPVFARPLTEATGVWMGGGAQDLLMKPYLGTEVERQLKALLDRGGVIGGTSAGASVMSRVMIAGGRDKAELADGFGFLPDVVIDQHFLRRNRIGRLLGVLSAHPDLIGIGIDEQAVLEVNLRDSRMKVLGLSYVVACVPDEAKKSVRMNIFSNGDSLDLGALKSPPALSQPWMSPLGRHTYLTLESTEAESGK
jgi:cyanophycinase